MLFKILTLGASGLLSLTLLGVLSAASQPPEEPPPPKKKGLDFNKQGGDTARRGAEAGPEADLHRAYNLLRRLRADAPATRSADPRIGEWTERAARYYREGIRALRDENPQLAHESAVIAHDLARAIEHTRNAALFDKPDAELPPPPEKAGSGGAAEARRQLMAAYDQFREEDDGGDAGPEAKYFRDAAGELYRTALRDFESGRVERAGELARAAEAMRHIAAHLGHAADVRKAPPPKAEPRERRGLER
ncbi:MAG TPA: hypothetical protein VFF52_29350 [Isosphaeraceae bacterium]|nr:hypothetical protein [Isosphaeraceae bacterium]